jgi:hypothetical protein
MRRLKNRQKEKQKVKSFQIEEEVYFWMNNIYMKKQSKKLNNKSIESFRIVKDIKEISYELDLFKKCEYI